MPIEIDIHKGITPTPAEEEQIATLRELTETILNAFAPDDDPPQPENHLPKSGGDIIFDPAINSSTKQETIDAPPAISGLEPNTSSLQQSPKLDNKTYSK